MRRARRTDVALRGALAVAALLPWLRMADGTYGLYFFVLVLGGRTFFPLAMLFALVSFFVLLFILPVAGLWRAAHDRPPRFVELAARTGLSLSLVYHAPFAAFVGFVAVTDARNPADLLYYPAVSLLLSTAVTALALVYLLKTSRRQPPQPTAPPAR